MDFTLFTINLGFQSTKHSIFYAYQKVITLIYLMITWISKHEIKPKIGQDRIWHMNIWYDMILPCSWNYNKTWIVFCRFAENWIGLYFRFGACAQFKVRKWFIVSLLYEIWIIVWQCHLELFCCFVFKPLWAESLWI